MGAGFVVCTSDARFRFRNDSESESESHMGRNLASLVCRRESQGGNPIGKALICIIWSLANRSLVQSLQYRIIQINKYIYILFCAEC